MAVILLETFVKDPDEKLDYGFDWANALGSDTISASTWVVPSGITQSSTPPPSATSGSRSSPSIATG